MLCNKCGVKNATIKGIGGRGMFCIKCHRAFLKNREVTLANRKERNSNIVFEKSYVKPVYVRKSVAIKEDSLKVMWKNNFQDYFCNVNGFHNFVKKGLKDGNIKCASFEEINGYVNSLFNKPKKGLSIYDALKQFEGEIKAKRMQ